MKFFKILSVFAFVVLAFMYCTKTDQIVAPTATANTSELTALKTANAPNIDGVIDTAWAKATAINFTAAVPDPGNALFAGYVGEKYPVSLKAMYDDQYVYFLAQYADADPSQKVAPWYFDHRSLFARRGHSPIWLELLAYGIVAVVWAVIIYLLFQIRNIKKLGLE
jgi:hypothetical protein